ncbi:RagB/SusD family nutrient uptake outer membrane protein [Olivibacter sp. SDN3]|nr:RagB/SusD family nutrient uptake outer membrane protein [Olivibacter sp. SDN3]
MVCGLLIILSSCQKDFFDQVPDDRITMEDVFNRRVDSEKYLANIYNRIKEEGNQWTENPWVGVADEADMTWAQHFTAFINLGSWDPNANYAQHWQHYYQGVRSATYFMENIGGNEEILALGQQGEQLIARYTAEARFLRAYFYFCLLRQYGPIILVPELIAPDAPLEEVQFPRSTYDECVNYIVGELDEIAEQLPSAYSDPTEKARATSVWCRAVKSRLLLYAASALYNGNTDYAGFTNTDGTPLINPQYDENKWRVAAEASKALIDLGMFELYKEYDSEGNIDPFLSYQNVFLEHWNSEQIFVRMDWDHQGWERYSTPRIASGYSGVGVTQQQVDTYFMENGKAIDEEGSGYLEEGFAASDGKYHHRHDYNMYANREPRFYVSIVYNGSYWINTSEGDRQIGLHRTGNSGLQGSWDHSKTGYLVRKNIHPNSNPRIGLWNRRPYAHFRLAEIYLNYAEALNEYDPGNIDITRYLNLVRERAGLPPVENGLSQEEMRQRIRQERRVELAFESHRFFDTRRWKIAEETDGGNFYGMNVEEGNSYTDPSFYQRTVFERRVFQSKHYLWPIPQSEMDRNRNLIQNPGW